MPLFYYIKLLIRNSRRNYYADLGLLDRTGVRKLFNNDIRLFWHSDSFLYTQIPGIPSQK